MKNNYTIIIITLITLLFFSCVPNNSGGRSGNSDRGGSTPQNIKLVVDEGGNDGADDVGWYSSIAVDGSNVYISYYDFTNDDLWCAKSTDYGNNWNLLPADVTSDDVGEYTSIALNEGNIYILYSDNTNGKLKFARSINGGINWDRFNINPEEESFAFKGYGSPPFSSLAIDNYNSRFYISYFDYNSKVLKSVKSIDKGENWTSLTVDDGDHVGEYTSIAANRTNCFISYYDRQNGYLKVAKSIFGGGWNKEILDGEDDNVGLYTSLVSLNVDGYMYFVVISYYNQTKGELWLARLTWDTDGKYDSFKVKIDGGDNDVGKYTSLAADDNVVYISYYDNTNKNLKFAKVQITLFSEIVKIVDNSTNVGRYSSIAVNEPYVYISYFDDENGDLKFVRSVDGGYTWAP